MLNLCPVKNHHTFLSGSLSSCSSCSRPSFLPPKLLERVVPPGDPLSPSPLWYGFRLHHLTETFLAEVIVFIEPSVFSAALDSVLPTPYLALLPRLPIRSGGCPLSAAVFLGCFCRRILLSLVNKLASSVLGSPLSSPCTLLFPRRAHSCLYPHIPHMYISHLVCIPTSRGLRLTDTRCFKCTSNLSSFSLLFSPTPQAWSLFSKVSMVPPSAQVLKPATQGPSLSFPAPHHTPNLIHFCGLMICLPKSLYPAHASPWPCS